MTDRIKGFTVVLDEDIRIDDIESIVTAIKMIKGICAVEPIISDSSDLIIRSRIKREITSKLYKIIEELNE